MATTSPAPFKFKVLRQVTLPTFKLKKGREYFLKFETAMELGKEIKNSTMGRATVMRAVDLETGELGIVLCPTILRNELAEQYPGDAYIGRCFSVVLYKVPEKRWTGVTLSEVSDPTEDAAWKDAAALEYAKRKAEGAPADEEDPEDDPEEDLETEGEQTEVPPMPRNNSRSKPAGKSRRR